MPEQTVEYYDEIYGRGPYDEVRYHRLWDLVYEWAGDPNVVCDFGCGTGGMLDRWTEPRPMNMYGLDFSQEALKQARSKPCDDVNFMKWDIIKDRFPFSLRPCLCTCIETLEHLDDDVLVFDAMCSVSDRVICSVPYRDRIPSPGHIDDRMYDEEMVIKRFGPMHRIENIFDNFLMFEWRG